MSMRMTQEDLDMLAKHLTTGWLRDNRINYMLFIVDADGRTARSYWIDYDMAVVGIRDIIGYAMQHMPDKDKALFLDNLQNSIDLARKTV